MNKIGIGMVGLGGFASGRLPSIKEDERADLVAVLTRRGSEERVKGILQKHGLEAELEFDEEVFFSRKDIQTVFVSVPNALHYRVAKKSILSGKHTLVEYPMTQSLEEYDELVSLAKEKGVVLHHALTVLQEPLYQSMRRNLSRVGGLVYSHLRYFGGKKWYVSSSLRGDPFVSLHIHFLYQFYKLFEGMEFLGATLKEKEGEYTFGSILLRFFPSKMTGIIDFGMGLRERSYSWTIVGEKGTIVFDKERGNKLLFKGEKEETLPLEGEGVDDTKNFIAQVLLNAPPHISLEEGRKAIELSLLASEMAKK